MTAEAPNPRRHWRLLPAVLLGILLGAGLFTVHYARGTSYLRNDPESCVNCHVMREHFDAWRMSSHHATATCNDCHVSQRSPLSAIFSKSGSGFRHAVAFTAGTYPEHITIHEKSRAVVQENCVRCHREMVSMVRAAAPARATCGDEGCVRCHARAGHGAGR